MSSALGETKWVTVSNRCYTRYYSFWLRHGNLLTIKKKKTSNQFQVLVLCTYLIWCNRIFSRAWNWICLARVACWIISNESIWICCKSCILFRYGHLVASRCGEFTGHLVGSNIKGISFCVRPSCFYTTCIYLQVQPKKRKSNTWTFYILSCDAPCTVLHLQINYLKHIIIFFYNQFNFSCRWTFFSAEQFYLNFSIFALKSVLFINTAYILTAQRTISKHEKNEE